MDDSGRDVTDPGPLCSIADFTGYDLQAINKAIGKPLIAALESNDEVGMYAFVWRAEARRDGNDLTFDQVMDRPFGQIMEAFAGANGDLDVAAVDPTTAGSGDA